MSHSDHDSDLLVELHHVSNSASRSNARIPVVDLHSSSALPELKPEAFSDQRLGDASGRAPGELWLDGHVLMCACPDCGAPMSVRIWLMVADCWQCGASIELSEEQEREAQRLLQQQATSANVRSDTGPIQDAASARSARPAERDDSRPNSNTDTNRSRAAAQSDSRRPTDRDRSATRRSPSTTRYVVAPPPAPRPVRLASPNRRVSAWLSDLFGCTPAWLVSLVFHLILLTLLALFTIGAQDEGPYITLSTTVSKDVQFGGDTLLVDPLNEVVFDLPLPQDVDLTDQRQRQAAIRADQDARELRLDPDAPEPDLPELSQVMRAIGTSTGGGQALAARDPRIRTDVVRREGGTTLTEAAVARGLRWLAKHQDRDGKWSLDGFNRSSGCTCNGGGTHSDAAGTSLALLPFLGAGQTHLVGRYREQVSGGLRWLISHQKADGDMRAGAHGNTGMYAHGQATIVLCEAYVMTGDESLRLPAQRAVNFIVAAQHTAGGWRYSPGQAGDTSVVGWQVMALQSARAARLSFPPETLELAGHFLDTVAHADGAKYSYLAKQNPTHVMTAEALLCRMYLGWKLDMPALRDGVDYLLADHPPNSDKPDIYYWYYGTQTLHHHGGAEWERWNKQMREILIETQERRGHEAGSWDPRGPHASAGGRLYMTALATCSLEVYYRHLPIFRQIDLN